MNIEDYLVSEGIGTEEKSNFLDLLKPKLSEEQYLENSLLYKESRAHPENGPELFPKMYELMAKYDLFKEFWQANAGHLINNAQFIRDNLPGQRNVLDIGCADGLKTVYYALNFPGANFIGIDRCGGAIALAQEKAQKRGLSNASFVPADLYQPCFKPNSFDTVIATQVLHEDYATFAVYDGFHLVYLFGEQIKSLSEVLAPKGIMLITLLVNDAEQIESEIRRAAAKACLQAKKVSVKEYQNGPCEITALNFVLQK